MTSARGAARRLVDDVRRLGIDTAADISERFARLVAPLDGRAAAGNGRYDRLAGDVVEAMAAMFRVVQDLAEIAGVTPTDGTGTESLVVPVAAPGASGKATMWLHNTSTEDATAVTLTASDLVGPAGRLPAAVVSLEPASLDGMPAGTSRGVTVIVDVPAQAASGGYHGVVTGIELPGTVLALRVEVGPDPT